jgi:hypothetical protein
MLTSAVFFSLNGSGKPGNLLTIVLALSMLPVALALHQRHRISQPDLSLAASLIGIVAMLAAASLQVLLLVGAVQPEGIAYVMDNVTFGLVGVWLILMAYLGRSSKTLAPDLVWLAVAAGLGIFLSTTGFLLSNPPPVWAMAGGAVTIIAYPFWAVAVGRTLASGELAAVAS